MSTRKKEDRLELLQGTLDLLILRTLLSGRAHGHAIAKAIECNSEDVLASGADGGNHKVGKAGKSSFVILPPASGGGDM